MAQSARKILMTGVPGTGKSTAARTLAGRTGSALLDINKTADALSLYSHVDEEDGAKVVKLAELEAKLAGAIRAEKRGVVVEGHLGCEMRLPVSRVIVLRCEPKILRQRLSSRNYPEKKISENAMAEALDYCTVMSEKKYGKAKVWEIDTSALRAGEVVAEAEKIMLGKRRKKTHVSFPDALMREAVSGEKIRALMGG